MATTDDLQKTADKAADAVVDAAVAAPRTVAALAEAAPVAAAAVVETVAKALPKAKPVATKRKPAAKSVVVARRAKPVAKTVKPRPNTTAAKAATKATAAKAATKTTAAKAATKTTAAKAATKAKGTIMTDTVKTVTAQGEKIVAELKSRTDDAVAKSKAMFADATEFGKGNIEALVESGKIAAKGFEKLGQDQADYARKSFEQTTAAFKGMAAIKSPTDLVKLHSDYVRGAFDAMVAQTSHSTEAFLKLAGEVAQPISNRFAVAAEKVKLAA